MYLQIIQILWKGIKWIAKVFLLHLPPSSIARKDSSHYLCVPPEFFYSTTIFFILLGLFSFLWASLCQTHINILRTNPIVRFTFKKAWSQSMQTKNNLSKCKGVILPHRWYKLCSIGIHSSWKCIPVLSWIIEKELWVLIPGYWPTNMSLGYLISKFGVGPS